jgi:hypothetical protein
MKPRKKTNFLRAVLYAHLLKILHQHLTTYNVNTCLFRHSPQVSSRVTGLGEFSPLKRLFILSNFVRKSYK